MHLLLFCTQSWLCFNLPFLLDTPCPSLFDSFLLLTPYFYSYFPYSLPVSDPFLFFLFSLSIAFIKRQCWLKCDYQIWWKFVTEAAAVPALALTLSVYTYMRVSQQVTILLYAYCCWWQQAIFYIPEHWCMTSQSFFSRVVSCPISPFRLQKHAQMCPLCALIAPLGEL